MVAIPPSGDEARWWVRCVSPWDQFNRDVKPGTYLDTFDGDVEAFVRRYELRFGKLC